MDPAFEGAHGRILFWQVNNITPSYGDWEVKDPIGAGRCPDTFKMPKRIAE
jgi:hypothetical protein